MARARAILSALALAYRRDWTAFQSLAGNNFFLITAFLLRTAGIFVYLIMGLVVLFPLSTDPLRKIPPSRLALWPLDRRDRWILRLASPFDPFPSELARDYRTLRFPYEWRFEAGGVASGAVTVP